MYDERSLFVMNMLLWNVLLLWFLPPTAHAFALEHNPQHQHQHQRHSQHKLYNQQNDDSWSLITLGDLHMEDDMTLHEQARQDCLHAIRDYSPITNSASVTTTSEDDDVSSRIQTLLQRPAGDLTMQELQLLLSHKQQQRLNEQLDRQLESEHPSDKELNANNHQAHLVSLGDLGRGQKNSRHSPGDAGTSQCFAKAKDYFDGFAGISYDLVTGNHDLEALDEFATDQDNLQAWMDCFDKPTPQFYRYLGDKTLLLGLSTVQFRDAPYSSHEVHVDDAQLEWFRTMVSSHSHEDGWTILVFSHAPILGSGLTVLQNVHVASGCAWLNHCSPPSIRNQFLNICRDHPQIKCWASGHFHLSHEYPNTLVQVGACTFCQVGVIGKKSTRDGKRQTRFFRKCRDQKCIEIYTINHHIRVPIAATNGEKRDETRDNNHEEETKAQVRLDATIDLTTGQLVKVQDELTNGDELSVSTSAATAATTKKDQGWFQAYIPQQDDGCYLEDLDGSIGGSSGKVCWWHMADGKVLGLHQGQVVEYDAETLAPLGVVVMEEQLNNREVLVVQNKTVLVLVDDSTHDIEVVHPNADGSYWRKFSKSKVIRLEEQAREEVAKRWIMEQKKQRQPTK